MKNLVVEYKGIPSVSHLVVAENTNNEIRSVSKIITNYLKDFEEFGAVRFEIATEHLGLLEPSANKFLANQARKIYWLNEEQATLLLTYLQNTPIVREFKKALIKEFYQMRETFTIANDKFTQVLTALSEKSTEADRFRQKYYESLELTNKLLLEKLQGNTNYNKRLSDSEKAEILRLYKNGFLLTEICKKMKRSDAAVRSVIRSVL